MLEHLRVVGNKLITLITLTRGSQLGKHEGTHATTNNTITCNRLIHIIINCFDVLHSHSIPTMESDELRALSLFVCVAFVHETQISHTSSTML